MVAMKPRSRASEPGSLNEVPPVNLLFHGVGRPRRAVEPGEEQYWVTPDFLSAVLDVAVEQPFVRLSFDDCNASDADTVLPALVSRGLWATFFPISGRVGSAGSLSEQGVREIAAAGMNVGTHGRRHIAWRRLAASAATDELVTAREELEQLVQQPITEAACPFGAYEWRTLRTIRGLGYHKLFTSDGARAPAEQWLQPRYTLRSDQTIDEVKALVTRGGLGVSRYRDRARVKVKQRRW